LYEQLGRIFWFLNRAPLESLINNHDALRVPVNIDIGRSRPLTTRMWEQLFREMEQAALNTDMRIYDQALANTDSIDRGGFDYIRRQTDRFAITSVNRGSVVIEGLLILAAGGAWFFKHFIAPGWEKSASKKEWDDGVAAGIDTAIPFLKEQVDYHVVHRLKRLKIRRVLFRHPPNETGLRLADNTSPHTELVYDKPKQITHKKD
jgi:hypothetical protein